MRLLLDVDRPPLPAACLVREIAERHRGELERVVAACRHQLGAEASIHYAQIEGDIRAGWVDGRWVLNAIAGGDHAVVLVQAYIEPPRGSPAWGEPRHAAIEMARSLRAAFPGLIIRVLHTVIRPTGR